MPFLRYHTTTNSTTQSAISDDILTVEGKEIDTKTINTNTENTLHQLDKISSSNDISNRNEDNSPNKKDPYNSGPSISGLVIVMK